MQKCATTTGREACNENWEVQYERYPFLLFFFVLSVGSFSTVYLPFHSFTLIFQRSCRACRITIYGMPEPVHLTRNPSSLNMLINTFEAGRVEVRVELARPRHVRISGANNQVRLVSGFTSVSMTHTSLQARLFTQNVSLLLPTISVPREVAYTVGHTS